MSAPTTFWDDLADDLKDPDFLRDYVVESIRIATVDTLVNRLDDARVAAGLSKSALAHAINMNSATMRRLFSGGATNPTLGTLAEVAAALGMRVSLEPLPESEQAQVTRPLLDGQSADLLQLAQYLEALRRPKNRAA